MGSYYSLKTNILLAILFIILVSFDVDAWEDGRATFYGDIKGGETMNGACGYGDLFKQGYGLETAALSTSLFNNGLTCGACYQIYCFNSPFCKPNARNIQITGTNFCPPPDQYSPYNWCAPPQKHFDLSMKMFLQIAEYKAGVVPVKFQRVPCNKKGGVKFELKGNPDWLLVLVFNVGGMGDVTDVQIKGSSGGWMQMTRNWGQNWQSGNFIGQSLSFKVTISDGKTIEFDNVVSGNWKFGQTYDGWKNF